MLNIVGAAANEAPKPSPLNVTANTGTSAILEAINEMSKRMEDQFNKLEVSLQATQSALAKHDTRISAVEATSSDPDTRLTELKQQSQLLEAR